MSDIFKTKVNNQWVGIPSMVGPQGPQGIQGIQGVQGPAGQDGAAAGINSATATVAELARNATPTVSASVSGPDTAKDFSFAFGLPKVSKTYWVTVTASNWTLDSTTGRYTKTVTYSTVPVTADSLLWFGADPDSMDEVYSKVIYPSGQGDHTITYTAYEQPSQTVRFGIMIV